MNTNKDIFLRLTFSSISVIDSIWAIPKTTSIHRDAAARYPIMPVRTPCARLLSEMMVKIGSDRCTYFHEILSVVPVVSF
jgi:hypothetical protein